MTGPEHYRLGETLLTNAWKRSTSDDEVFIHTPERRAELVAVAQAHFTAALAAATALAGNTGLKEGHFVQVADEWHDAAGGAS